MPEASLELIMELLKALQSSQREMQHQIDAGFTRMDAGFTRMDGEFREVKTRLLSLELTAMAIDRLEVFKRQEEHAARLDRIEAKLGI